MVLVAVFTWMRSEGKSGKFFMGNTIRCSQLYNHVGGGIFVIMFSSKKFRMCENSTKDSNPGNLKIIYNFS